MVPPKLTVVPHGPEQDDARAEDQAPEAATDAS